MSRRLLIVGFGPFPRVPWNPSGLLAARIAASPRWRRLDVAPDLLILPTTYAALEKQLEPALARQPAAVLMIGVAGRARGVRIEQRAVNRASVLFPDATGFRPARMALAAAGPLQRRSAVARVARLALQQRGVPAALSRDAGRYLCNASYYRALAEPSPVVFLHIPKLPDPHRIGIRRPSKQTTVEQWAEAFTQAGIALLTRARRQGTGTSSVSRSTESR